MLLSLAELANDIYFMQKRKVFVSSGHVEKRHFFTLATPLVIK